MRCQNGVQPFESSIKKKFVTNVKGGGEAEGWRRKSGSCRRDFLMGKLETALQTLPYCCRGF